MRGRGGVRRPAIEVVLAVVAGLLIGGGVAVAWLLLRDDGFTYDEQAHQRVIEAAYGDDYVKDWPKYRDVWLDVCEEENLALNAAVFTDGGTSPGEFALNIEYVCPDRSDELPPAFRILD